MDTLGKRINVKFLGFVHWFMSINISWTKDHSNTVDQDRYTTSIEAKYLDTSTVIKSKKFYNTTLTYYIIFTKNDLYTSDDQVDELTRKLNMN